MAREIPQTELRKSLEGAIKIETSQRKNYCCGDWIEDQIGEEFSPTFNERSQMDGAIGYVEVETPIAGDLIFYYSTTIKKYDVWKHIGVCMDEKTVHSKWGLGNVFSHPIEIVPYEYGELVRFFRKVPKL